MTDKEKVYQLLTSGIEESVRLGFELIKSQRLDMGDTLNQIGVVVKLYYDNLLHESDISFEDGIKVLSTPKLFMRYDGNKAIKDLHNYLDTKGDQVEHLSKLDEIGKDKIPPILFDIKCFGGILLKECDIEKFDIKDISHLQYLRFEDCIFPSELPKAIWESNLEVLDIVDCVRFKGAKYEMPEIWNLKNLRQLRVTGTNLKLPYPKEQVESLMQLGADVNQLEFDPSELSRLFPNLKQVSF